MGEIGRIISKIPIIKIIILLYSIVFMGDFYTFIYKKSDHPKQKKPNEQVTTISSTKIPEKNYSSVEDELNKAVDTFQKKVNKILKKHERMVPNETYKEIGIIQFPFIDN